MALNVLTFIIFVNTFIAGVLKAATAVGLREKSPEEFRAVMQAMAEQTERAPQQVFVDADAVEKLTARWIRDLKWTCTPLYEGAVVKA